MISNISRFIFLFLLFSTIIANFVTQVISCQTQYFLDNNIYGKHVVGIVMAFAILMMDGGWSFKQDDHETNWTNGNVLDTMFYSIGIYILFLLSAKMRIHINILFYFILFITYCINTQRLYWLKRNMIDEKQNSDMIIITKCLSIFSIFVLIYGLVDYYFYQKMEYKKKFTLFDFFLGKFKCDGRKNYLKKN